MKNTILFLIGICAISCSNSNSNNNTDITPIEYFNFEVIEVDSCEYLVGYSFNKGYMAHKGNCKYCIKRYGTVDSKR